MCSLRDAAKDLRSLDVNVFGASLDDVRSLAGFAKAQSLEFPLLSDPDGSLAGKYRVLYEGRPFAKRVTFVIDPKGVIRHVDRTVDVSTHGSDLVGAVRALQEADAR